MSLAVLDASVLIAILSGTDVHNPAASSWLRERRASNDSLVLPCSAYGEVLVGAYRRGGADVSAVERLVDQGLLGLVAPDRPITREAAAIRAADPALSLPDALVLATGRILGADIVATTDTRWARHESTVVVID